MSEADRRLWDGMLGHLRTAHADIGRQWFEELEPAGVSGGAFHLRAHSMVHRDYLRRVCADAFNDAARTVSGHLLSVRFLGPQEEAPPAENGKGKSGGRTSFSPGLPRVLPSTVVEGRPTTPAGAAAGSGANGSEGPVPAPTLLMNGVPAARTGETRGSPPTSATVAGLASHATQTRTLSPFLERPRDDSLIINPDCSFENFVIGPGNRLGHAAALAVADNPGRSYNPYFIHGGVGLGKTHLLQAICLKILERNPNYNLSYISCDGFISQFMESLQSGKMAEFRHRFRDVDVLVIDDVHFLAKRESSQEEFFHTFNSLFQGNRQLILSSDAPPQDIPDLEERLVSRFKWGLVTEIEKPNYETRVQIVKTKARLRGLIFPDNVCEYVATILTTNIRELEGAVVKIQMVSQVDKKPIDLDLAKRSLGDSTTVAATELNIQTIMTAVCDFFSVRIPDVQGQRRQRSIALPRQVCMYFARQHTRMSLEEIGGYFGGRDHTTVMHAVSMVSARRGEEPDFAETLASLEAGFLPSQRLST